MDYEAILKALTFELTKLGYPDDAEDATQDFFLRKLEGKSQKQILKFHARDYLCRNYGNPKHGTHLSLSLKCSFEDVFHSPDESQYDLVFSKEILERSRMIVGLYNPKWCELFDLVYLNGSTVLEMAKIYNVSNNRVYQKIAKMEELVCTYLAKDYRLKDLSKTLSH